MARAAYRDTVYRSTWEAQYSTHLKALEKQNQIQSFSYESIRLRISGQGFYTPDFLVIGQDDEVQFHEVKGLKRDAGMVRLRTAAHQHRWARFFLVTKGKGQSNGGEWQIEEIV